MSSEQPDQIFLSFPARPEYLILARLALSGLARTTPIEADLLGDLKLAVTESCSNAVQHAYKANGNPGVVRLAIWVTGSTLHVRVEDEGSGLGTIPPEPELGVAHDSGLGLAIMRMIMDDVSVSARTDGQGTAVEMSKRID